MNGRTTKERRWPSFATYLPPKADTLDSTSITEVGGWIPLDKQVQLLIDSGKYLDAFRKELYDFQDENDIDEDYDDPTRAPGYDIVDAWNSAEELAQRYKAAHKRERAKKKAEQEEPKPDLGDVNPHGKDQEPVKDKKDKKD